MAGIATTAGFARIGQLDRRITIQEESAAGVWSAISSFPNVWAARQDRSGTEPRHGRIEAPKDVVWTIRYRSDITTAHRISDGATIYHINAMREVGRARWLQLFSEVVVGDATARGTAVITRPDTDARSFDSESGQPVGAAPDPVEVYNGEVFLDERAEAVMRAQGGGDTDVSGRCVVKIPADDLTTIFDVETDSVSLTYRGRTRTATILEIMYLEAWIILVVTWETRATAA